MKIYATALSILVCVSTLAGCGDDDPEAPPPGQANGQDSDAPAFGDSATDDSDGGNSDGGNASDGEPVGCVGCALPSCSIGCVPHTVDEGDSTTFFWSSDGNDCRFACEGRAIDMDVPCMGDNTELFQDLQESIPCTLTARRGEVESSCSDIVIVLGN